MRRLLVNSQNTFDSCGSVENLEGGVNVPLGVSLLCLKQIHCRKESKKVIFNAEDRPSTLPKNFRAAVLSRLSQPLKAVAVVTPEYLTAGQLLVELHYSGACASQIHEIDGRKGEDPYLPHMLGHEGVGTVRWVGPGVSQHNIGDVVVAHWRKSIGMQAAPVVYETSSGPVNAGSVTTFSEYAVISENRLTRLPGGFDLESAPLLGCALTTGYGAVTKEAKVLPGESALIVGFGGIGISVLKTLRMVSATPIVVLDISDEKIELARSLGADIAINTSDFGSGFGEKVIGLLGKYPDVIFEATGVRHCIEQAYEMAGTVGRTLLLGVPNHDDPARLPTLPLHLGRTLMGSHGGSSIPEYDIPRLAKLVQSGQMTLSDFPKTLFSLADVNEALNTLRAGTPGRVMIKFGL